LIENLSRLFYESIRVLAFSLTIFLFVVLLTLILTVLIMVLRECRERPRGFSWGYGLITPHGIGRCEGYHSG